MEGRRSAALRHERPEGEQEGAEKAALLKSTCLLQNDVFGMTSSLTTCVCMSLGHVTHVTCAYHDHKASSRLCLIVSRITGRARCAYQKTNALNESFAQLVNFNHLHNGMRKVPCVLQLVM